MEKGDVGIFMTMLNRQNSIGKTNEIAQNKTLLIKTLEMEILTTVLQIKCYKNQINIIKTGLS